ADRRDRTGRRGQGQSPGLGRRREGAAGGLQGHRSEPGVMEATVSNSLVFGSPFLAVAVMLLAKGKWLFWLAIVAVYIALLTWFMNAKWGGPGDMAVGRGMTAMFGLAALFLTGLVSLFVIISRLGRRNRDEAGNAGEQV